MTKSGRPSARQMRLFPTPSANADPSGVEAKVELVEALADLLLEALGHEHDEEEGDDEFEDHA